MAQALAVELPDTLSDTHRCRHFLSSREPSVWLTGTRESIKEPDGAGVLIPPAPSPPAMSELNAHGVQKQVPTPNTFIRSHTAGRAPPPWTPGSCRCRRWNRRYHGPPRMAARTVSCTVPTTARGTSASCTPPGSGNAACFPRPARSATRDNAMAESSDGAYRTELVWRRKPFRDFEGPGIGDVPVGLVAGTRSVCTSPWATGHRNRPKPSIMQTKRRKPPHYKGGTKIRPYQIPCRFDLSKEGPLILGFI